MAFTTKRGRPRKPVAPAIDLGTPELRLKHALSLTTEPIDLCLERSIITEAQHWCGLHLRWLYTLRYGAPTVTTRYADENMVSDSTQDPDWHAMRTHEYQEAIALLISERRYECVMKLAVFNEHPTFLNARLLDQARHKQQTLEILSQQRLHLREGLELLVKHWKRR